MAKLKDGFYKLTASSIGSDLLVLLAGGGAKPIADFATTTDLSGYLPLTGGTLTGNLAIKSGNSLLTVYPTGTNNYCGIIGNMSTSSSGTTTHGLVFNASSCTSYGGKNSLTLFNTRGNIYFQSSLGVFESAIIQRQPNDWLTTAGIQIGRSNATIYTDRAVIGVTNGNLHLDSYSGYAIYFNHYVGNTSGLTKGMVLTSSGSLGIGIEPTQKLHVNGLVNITANEKTVTIGSQNTSHCHYSTTAPSHWFNKDVLVAGHIYGGSDYNRRVAYADELHSKDAGIIGWSITNSGAYSYSNTQYGIWYQNHYSGHGLGNYRGVLSCKDNGVGFELNSYWCVNPSDSANLNNLYFRVKRDAASDWGPYSRLVTLSFSGSIYADHFYEHSDATLKTNIETINTSDNMPQLKSFDWKENGKHSYGLIAQELEEMGYSELVEESNGKKTVQYSAALSLIVGKLQVKIKELEEKIENFKNKN